MEVRANYFVRRYLITTSTQSQAKSCFTESPFVHM